MKRKALKITKLYVKELSPEAQEELNQAFSELEVLKTNAVKSERVASQALLAARADRSLAQKAEVGFIDKAANYFNEVSTELVWFAYRKEGTIVLESPFTERDARNAVRVQRAQLDQSARELDENMGGELYEDDDQGQEPTGDDRQ